MSPLSAYPKNYKLGSDNSSWLMRLKFKYFQVPLTGGPRVSSGFWKFREFPIVLFGIKGKGWWRAETSNGLRHAPAHGDMLIYEKTGNKNCYLSRIQPWTRFHFALLYPLGITWHIFWKKETIVPVGEYKSDFGIKKLFAGYLGWIRDSDITFKPKLYVGGNFE